MLRIEIQRWHHRHCSMTTRAWRWYHWYCDRANNWQMSIKTGCLISGGNNAILPCNSDAAIWMPPSKHDHFDATILIQESWGCHPNATIRMLPSQQYLSKHCSLAATNLTILSRCYLPNAILLNLKKQYKNNITLLTFYS